jgi:hypothetical protein
MLTENEKRLIQFKEAVRVYQNCKPSCLQLPNELEGKLKCFCKAFPT